MVLKKLNQSIFPRFYVDIPKKKITLNSERFIPKFINLYSGYFLYSLNRSIQSFSVIGGIIPEKKFQSVIDKPESVSLVKPPIITIINTIKAFINNHKEIEFE